MAAALAGGVEVLRRQTAREHPDATLEAASQSRREWFGRARGSVAGWTGRHRGGGGAGAGGAGADTARVEALERLGRLRESGVLDQAEFEAEKRRLLGSEAPSEGAA